MKRRILSNIILGVWLMVSPFALFFLNRGALKILWEDLLLGFGIAAFSFCRLYSRRSEEIAIVDWIMTALAVVTLINPLLYSYYNVRVAVWNNLAVGALVFLLALLQDWKDTDFLNCHPSHHHP